MCGIAGIIGENISADILDRMLFTQRHRGSDFTGKYITSGVKIGDNRLSIIDLSPQRERLGNELKEFVSLQIDRISSSENKKWFNFKALKQEWNNYLRGDNNSSFHIWQWVNTSLLLKQYA